MGKKKLTPWEEARARAQRQRREADELVRLREKHADSSFMWRFQLAKNAFAELRELITEWSSTATAWREDNGALVHLLMKVDKPFPPAVDTRLLGCVESLRASLDHLVFAIAERHCGSLDDKRARTVEFPIHRSAQHPHDKRAWRGVALIPPEGGLNDPCSTTPRGLSHQSDGVASLCSRGHR